MLLKFQCQFCKTNTVQYFFIYFFMFLIDAIKPVLFQIELGLLAQQKALFKINHLLFFLLYIYCCISISFCLFLNLFQLSISNCLHLSFSFLSCLSVIVCLLSLSFSPCLFLYFLLLPCIYFSVFALPLVQPK